MKQLRTICLCLLVPTLTGCGTTNKRLATEQLLVSDAVDKSIAQIDFTPLTNQTVYLDTQYIEYVKSAGFVNASYIISSLRQQMMAAGCWLQERQEDADYVVEARVGTLGSDDHEVTVGIPQNDSISQAASLVPGAPPVPPIPEISFAKRHGQQGAAKVAVFAYHRESRRPVWQSGISVARSNSKDTWLLGAGPLQRGSIYDGTHFAGARVGLPWTRRNKQRRPNGLVSYFDEAHFRSPEEARMQYEGQLAGFEEEVGGVQLKPVPINDKAEESD